MFRPHLEYGNTIWGPFYQGDKKLVEAVQRRATKLIPGLKEKTYEERLKLLKLPSLVYRRKRGDMIWMFKVMNGLVRVDTTKLFIPARLMHTRGHPQRVFKEHAVKVVRNNSFSQRVVNDWNSLPNYVVQAPSINTFKERLDKYWKHLHYRLSLFTGNKYQYFGIPIPESFLNKHFNRLQDPEFLEFLKSRFPPSRLSKSMMFAL